MRTILHYWHYISKDLLSLPRTIGKKSNRRRQKKKYNVFIKKKKKFYWKHLEKVVLSVHVSGDRSIVSLATVLMWICAPFLNLFFFLCSMSLSHCVFESFCGHFFKHYFYSLLLIIHRHILMMWDARNRFNQQRISRKNGSGVEEFIKLNW